MAAHTIMLWVCVTLCDMTVSLHLQVGTGIEKIGNGINRLALAIFLYPVMTWVVSWLPKRYVPVTV